MSRSGRSHMPWCRPHPLLHPRRCSNFAHCLRTDCYRGGFPLVHSVNGFRPHETAVYFERQTQFGDIPWPREGSAGTFLDSTQPVADGVRVAKKSLSRTAQRRIVVLPHPKRFEKHLPVLVGKVAKTI